jgi:hypothetical protein
VRLLAVLRAGVFVLFREVVLGVLALAAIDRVRGVVEPRGFPSRAGVVTGFDFAAGARWLTEDFGAAGTRVR